jgi:hypothetical protein
MDVENSGTFRISAGIGVAQRDEYFMQSGGMTAFRGSLGASGLLCLKVAARWCRDDRWHVINGGARVEPGGNKTAGTLSINGDYARDGQLSIELGERRGQPI